MFITVEGIKGSQRESVSRKIGTELEGKGYKPVYFDSIDPKSHGEGLDYLLEISETVRNSHSKHVLFSMFYFDSYCATLKGIDTASRKGFLWALIDVYKFMIPTLSLHLVCDPRVATNRLLAINSQEICVEKNIATCREWEEAADDFMANMLAIRTSKGSWRRELDMTLDPYFKDAQVEETTDMLLETERKNSVRKSRSKIRQELRSN